MLWACDEAWWDKHYREVALVFPGELWTVSAGAREKYGLRWIFGVDQGGYSQDESMIHTGRNGGFQALHIAALFGASRVVLLGYDFQATNNKSHWHGDHPPGLSNSRRRYGQWREVMPSLARDLERKGVEVVNATRHTALQCFRRAELKEAIACPAS